MDDPLKRALYPFEDVGEALSLLPLAARRALDVAGYRLSLEAYQGLSYPDRQSLAIAGAEERVDPGDVERIVKRGSPQPARIKPVVDPDPLMPPEQLNAALGPHRAVSAVEWSNLRALDRYALIHVMRRSIAHNDPARLEQAAQVILPRSKVRREAPGESARPAKPGLFELDAPVTRGGPRGSDPPPTQPAKPSAAPLGLEPRRDTRSYSSRPPPGSARSEAPSAGPSHLTAKGEVHMVDVGSKDVTARRATARGVVRMRPQTAERIARHDAPKGEVLASARVAGILAAKRTAELVPLCHPIALTRVEVVIDVEPDAGVVTVTAVADARDRTGVEMEALTAVSIACLTIYDMVKGIDDDLTIGDIRLVSKTGGRSRDHGRDFE